MLYTLVWIKGVSVSQKPLILKETFPGNICNSVGCVLYSFFLNILAKTNNVKSPET